MIRGIILLILSCVVLTLSADYTEELCHCNEPQYTRPVYEVAREYYPTPTTRDIDYTVRPNDCHDLQEFRDRVSVPDHRFIKETSTSLLSGLLLEVTRLIAEIVELVAELLRRIVGFRHERGIIDGILHGVLDGLLGSFRGCHHPLLAATLVDRLLDVSTRQRQLEHDARYLEESYNAAKVREELVGGQKNIYDKCMTVSRNMDTRERKCNGRSGSGGGLLGGLVGGLLNPSCGRGFLIDTVFGLVETVFDLVRDLLFTLVTLIANFSDALNLCLENLILLEDLELFEILTIQETYENEFRHGHIRPIIQQLENHHCVPQNDIYRRYSDIMRDDQSRNHYYHLCQLPVRGYKFHDFQMTCRNSKGIDICLDLDILGIVRVNPHIKIDLNIFCEIRLGIDLDVNVNLGPGRTHSIHDGANDILESIRVVTQGITGCNHVETSIVDIDLEVGSVVANLNLLPEIGQTLCNPLIDVDIDIGIGGILTGVPGHARRHITECNSYNDIESLTYAIRDADTKINQYTTQGSQYNDDLKTHLYNTHDLATYQDAEATEYQQNLENYGNDEDVLKHAYDTVQFYTHKTNRSLEEYKCALEQYQRAIDITEARIHTCRKEYLEARLRLLQNPTDQAMIEICAGAQIRFENLLQECIFLREFFTQVRADIQLRIGVLDRELLSICVDLQARIGLMERGLFSFCKDIGLHLSVDLNLLNFNNLLGSILRGLRPTIRSVECLLDNVLGIDILGMNCRIDDDCHEGESVEHMRHIHQQILRDGVAACTQNPYVQVCERQGYKRSAEENRYSVTIKNEPSATSTSGNVDFATEETGMTATQETTSSASSLVTSFLILLLSVLCFL